MAFKINISHKGKTIKLESENESFVGKRISDIFPGEDLSSDFKGYELEIKGTSDIAGKPGFKGLEGPSYHRVLLSKGKGMKDTRKGIRLRKTLRGEEISLKTIQINTIVKKEGEKKFSELIPAKEAKE